MSHERADCCKLGSLGITQRKADSFKGPERDGWSMILHVTVGPAEYANVTFCPFCGKKIEDKSDKKD